MHIEHAKSAALVVTIADSRKFDVQARELHQRDALLNASMRDRDAEAAARALATSQLYDLEAASASEAQVLRYDLLAARAELQAECDARAADVAALHAAQRECDALRSSLADAEGVIKLAHQVSPVRCLRVKCKRSLLRDALCGCQHVCRSAHTSWAGLRLPRGRWHGASVHPLLAHAMQGPPAQTAKVSEVETTEKQMALQQAVARESALERELAAMRSEVSAMRTALASEVEAPFSPPAAALEAEARIASLVCPSFLVLRFSPPVRGPCAAGMVAALHADVTDARGVAPPQMHAAHGLSVAVYGSSRTRLYLGTGDDDSEFHDLMRDAADAVLAAVTIKRDTLQTLRAVIDDLGAASLAPDASIEDAVAALRARAAMLGDVLTSQARLARALEDSQGRIEALRTKLEDVEHVLDAVIEERDELHEQQESWRQGMAELQARTPTAFAPC